MPSKFFDLIGIASSVIFGKGGARMRSNAGVMEARNNADSALAILRAAAPVGDDDLVTKRFLETRAQVYVIGEIVSSAPSPIPTEGAIYICTTGDGSYTQKKLYRYESSAFVDIFPGALPGAIPEGLVMKVTDALNAGVDKYNADHLYIWDADNTEWDDVGPDPSGANYIKTFKQSFDSNDFPGTVNIGVPPAAGAIIRRVAVKVTTLFDGTTPTLDVGTGASPSRDMANTSVDLTTVGLYEVSVYNTDGAGTQMIATLAHGGVAPTQGDAEIMVEYRNP